MVRRRPWLTSLTAASVATGAAVALASGVPVTRPPMAQAAEGARPNILLINLDDMRPSGTLAVMPHVRTWFQEQGTTYSQNFASSPLCSPSRASLFTGRYGHNNGVTGNGLDAEIAALDQSATFQGYLHSEGYATAMAGKYMNTVPLSRSPQYWDHWLFTTGGYQDLPYNDDGTVKTIPGYYSTVLGDHIVQYLDTFEQKDDQPWLIYVAPQAPHSPTTPDAPHADSPVPVWNRPASFNEADVSDKPSAVRSRPLLDATAEEQLRTDQLRTLMSVDDMVGRITDEMTRLGEDQNTIAIFTSDNGYLWGEHRINDKRFPYADSEKVPLIVRWPGVVAPDATDDRLVSNVDILPTLLQVAGAAPTLKYPLDGTSLFSGQRRSQLLAEYGRSLDSPLAQWTSVITPTAQFTQWYDTTTGAPSEQEYYDLLADPDQLVNLLRDGNPDNDPPVAQWSAWLNALASCRGQQCVVLASGSNNPPVAVVDQPACTGLTCRFSGDDSTDSDGTVVGYGWQFGDGATGTGMTVSHTYAAPGVYPVTLTVTDDRGATGTATTTARPAGQSGQVAFRASASAMANAKRVTVTVPSAVRAGDAMLLLVAANRADSVVKVPVGWTLVRSASDSTLQSALWWRVATAADAGAVVPVTTSVTTKTGVHLTAYSGTASPPIAVSQTAVERGTAAAHRTPTVTAATSAGWLISMWTDKTSSSTGWTPPPGVVRRLRTVGTGGGRIGMLTVDSGAPVSAGTVGGLVATSTATSTMAVTWTVLLQPSPAGDGGPSRVTRSVSGG
jgi:arylsulfatase A-like enzyme/PKD repeat protein